MTPTCPICGAQLSYVEHVIVRNEYPVASVDIDTVEPLGQMLLLPVYDDEAKESILMEVLERTVHCSSINCPYHVEESDLGEALPRGIV